MASQIAYFGLWHYRASIDLVTRGKFDGAAMTDPLPWAMVDRRGFTSFAVNATTVVGQDICVAGHITALGAWDPTRALKRCAANYPIWSSTWRCRLAPRSGTSTPARTRPVQ